MGMFLEFIKIWKQYLKLDPFHMFIWLKIKSSATQFYFDTKSFSDKSQVN